MQFRIGALLVLLGLSIACAQPDGWAQVSADDLAREVAARGQNLTIVDVREPELFEAGHVPGAINIPYPAAKTRVLEALEPGQDIVFICHGGPMGEELAGILDAKGYPHVRNLKGGMKNWSGPLDRGS